MSKRTLLLLVRVWSVCAVVALLAGPGMLSMAVRAAPVRQENPTELVYGQTVDGRLDGEHPSVLYVFQASANDTITLTMISPDGSLDPFLVLNDAEHNVLATDDNSGGGTTARLTFTLPAAGSYIIQATSAGGIPPTEGGTYSLNLTAAVSESPTGAGEETSTATSDLPTEQGDSVRLAKLVPGATIRDALDRQTALRFYWFQGQAGYQVVVQPDASTPFQPLLTLYDAHFTEILRNTPGQALNALLAQSGVYFLAVSLPDTTSAGGDYGFVLDAISPLQNPGYIDIAYGENLRGSIDANTPSITYRFNGSAGDSVTIRMSRAGGDLDSYLYLLDGSGQLLYEDNDSGGENGDAQVLYTLPADGAYLITATRLGQSQGTTSGSYVLQLLSDSTPPAEAASAGPTRPSDYADFTELSYGETVTGELSDARYMDVYVFLGQAGDAITIDLASQNAEAVNGLDPFLILLDDQRIPLAENDDIVDSVERDSRLSFTLPRTAYYAIVATRFDQADGTSSGPYELTLTGPSGGSTQSTAGSSAETTTLSELAPAQLQPNTPAQAAFSGSAQLYTFSAQAGTLIDIAVTTDPGVDSIVILADADLKEILSSGTGLLTGITLPQTSQYLIIVAPRFGPVNPAGGYILVLTQTNAETQPADAAVAGPRVITYGDVVSGAIDDDATSQFYTFDGKAGEAIRISMEATPGSTLDCYLELQDANGTLIEANDDIDPGQIRDSQITTALPADGVYTIVASRYVGEDEPSTSGAYRLTLERLDQTAAPGVSTTTIPLAYGESETGDINDEQYLLFYVFEGSSGDVVTIQIDNTSGNLDSVLHLYRSVGDQWIEIANNDDSPSGGTYEALLDKVILPQTGKYLIAVNRYGLDREHTYGSFRITLTREQ